MNRRTFLCGLALSAVVPPVAGEAEQAAKIKRIGFLSPGSPSDPRATLRLGAFRTGLRELGYVEGQNIALDARWAGGKYERLSGLAAELVRLNVDVIVTYGPPAIRAAKEATGTIPIVMAAGVVDPEATGLIASLARPGGNVTGLTLMSPDLAGKQFQLLKEAVPKASWVALLANPNNPSSARFVREAEAAARALGVRLQTLERGIPRRSTAPSRR
jgi:putative ABC transport system substrate-binding protein